MSRPVLESFQGCLFLWCGTPLFSLSYRGARCPTYTYMRLCSIQHLFKYMEYPMTDLTHHASNFGVPTIL